MIIKILDEAEKESLGVYFLDSIMSDFESLHIYATVHISIHGYYRMLSKRFPFAIYYKVEADSIYIYAVLDCRQNPTWIEDRLESQ